MKHLTKVVILALFCAMNVGALERNRTNENDQCCRPIYECGCNPLYCGTYSGQLHAGVAPIIWTKRGEVDLLLPINPIFRLAKNFPKFKTLYKLPWTFGGILGYALSDNTEAYLEFNYLQATQKHHATGFSFVIPNLLPEQALVVRLSRYQLIDAYIGVRYYTNRFCNWISYFAGLKVGATLHRNINALLSVNGTPIVLVTATGTNACTPTVNANASNHFFNKNVVVAAGLNLGVDICFCGGWSFVITGEFVASCGPRLRGPSAFVPVLPPPTLATNIIFGGIGSELRFPITFGIKKVF